MKRATTPPREAPIMIPWGKIVRYVNDLSESKTKLDIQLEQNSFSALLKPAVVVLLLMGSLMMLGHSQRCRRTQVGVRGCGKDEREAVLN
jgi:hypothetical protein